MTVKVFAPAKVNLALHVTGRRENGYHELDSIVMFATIGDYVTVAPAESIDVTVTGPMAPRLPGKSDNLVMKTARLAKVPARIKLEKHLPVAAGLGGGSSDVAATWKALESMVGEELVGDIDALGADVPVCLSAQTARMRGIGDELTPLDGLPMLHAVLVNPNVPVLTEEVFSRLENRNNAPLPDEIPKDLTPTEFTDWLRNTRNDLHDPAIAAEPVIQQVFEALEVTPGCQLARMSGSGGTCFGIYQDAETAASAAGRLAETYPSWWITPTQLNAAAD